MKIKIKKINILIVIVATLFLLLTACNQNKTIPIKAALVYKTGAQPVLRTKFYLLKEDLKALKDKKDKVVFLPPMVAEALGEGNQAGIQEDKIKEYIVATTSTDFEGNAKFENVPKGIYYIAGFTTPRNEGGYFLWSVKVDTEQTKDAVLLDQNNAFESSNF